MALEVLEDLQDPEAFAPLLELCCRRDLTMKDADWRKALDALAFSYGNRDPLQIEQALKAVIAAENDLKQYAIWCLDNRQKRGGNGVAA